MSDRVRLWGSRAGGLCLIVCAYGDRVQVDYVVSGNLHTKLHALLSCLDFHVGDDDLTTEEKKKLLLTHHYIDDKDAILWRTFSKELGEEGIRPVTPVSNLNPKP